MLMIHDFGLVSSFSVLSKATKLVEVAVTASTGVAASHLAGQTLHSFAGVGIGRVTVQTALKKVRRNRATALRWQETRVLIVVPGQAKELGDAQLRMRSPWSMRASWKPWKAWRGASGSGKRPLAASRRGDLQEVKVFWAPKVERCT